MYHKHQTRGIILKSRLDGDHSRKVIIFTRDFGVLWAKVQGARETKSKLRSGSQDFALGEFSLVHGKNGWRLVSVNADQNLFETLRSDSSKLKVLTNVLNLINKLVGEEAGHGLLFDTIADFVEILVKAQESEVATLECLILLRILHSLGYMREDPDFGLPISRVEINAEILETFAPRRLQMIRLINESLKATHLT